LEGNHHLAAAAIPLVPLGCMVFENFCPLWVWKAEIRGRVTEMTERGADAHIDQLAKKYLGQDTYPYRRPGEVRVTVLIAPERVQTMG